MDPQHSLGSEAEDEISLIYKPKKRKRNAKTPSFKELGKKMRHWMFSGEEEKLCPKDNFNTSVDSDKQAHLLSNSLGTENTVKVSVPEYMEVKVCSSSVHPMHVLEGSLSEVASHSADSTNTTTAGQKITLANTWQEDPSRLEKAIGPLFPKETSTIGKVPASDSQAESQHEKPVTTQHNSKVTESDATNPKSRAGPLPQAVFDSILDFIVNLPGRSDTQKKEMLMTETIKKENLEDTDQALHTNAITGPTDVPTSKVISDPAESVSGTPNLDIRAMREYLKQKILRLSEQIRVEQSERDDNLSKYLQMISNTDRQHAVRVKQTFEKRNQKSSAAIAQLQRRLLDYHQRLKDLEYYSTSKQVKDLMQNVQQLGPQRADSRVLQLSHSLPRGRSGFFHASETEEEAILPKSRDLASLLKHRFGSCEEGLSLKEETQSTARLMDCEETLSSSTDDRHSDVTEYSGDGLSVSDGASHATSPKRNSLEKQNSQHLHPTSVEFAQMKEWQLQMEASFRKLRELYQTDYKALLDSLHEVNQSHEQLESELSDVMELHQNEMISLKQDISSIEEKLSYQSYERARDIWEVIDSLQNRISKLELQQQMVQQEFLESFNARHFFGKFMNVILTTMTILLVFVSSVSACVLPFIRTRTRILGTVTGLALGTCVWQYWDFLTSMARDPGLLSKLQRIFDNWMQNLYYWTS